MQKNIVTVNHGPDKGAVRRTLIKSVNHEKLEKIEKVTIQVKTEAQEVIPKVVPEEPKKIEERSEDMKTGENPFPRKGSVRSKERRKEILKSIGKQIRFSHSHMTVHYRRNCCLSQLSDVDDRH